MMLAYLGSKQSTHLNSRPLLIEMKREIEDAITLGGTIVLPEIKTVGLGKPTPGITLETDDPPARLSLRGSQGPPGLANNVGDR